MVLSSLSFSMASEPSIEVGNLQHWDTISRIRRRGVDESDPTHWEGFAEYSIPQYDHGWTNQARNEDGSWNFEWIAASGNLHYHVWTQNGIIGVLKHLGCRILVCLEELIGRTDSFVVVACIEKD